MFAGLPMCCETVERSVAKQPCVWLLKFDEKG